jgi:cytoskeletal protein CcmA (bactofilin family)
MAKDGDFSAFMGPGTEFQGQLSFKGTVRIDCRFVGTIVSDGKLILGKDASLEGTITVADLVVHGVFTGEAVVAKRTILHQGAKVTGNLTTMALVMEDGANLQGELYMGKDAESQRSLKAAQSLAAGQSDRAAHIIEASIEQ